MALSRPAALLSALLVSVLVLSGCAASLVPSEKYDDAEYVTIEEFTKMMERDGMSLFPVGEVTHSYAHETMAFDTERGETIQVLEYPDSTRAIMTVDRQAASAGTPPFFYRRSSYRAARTDASGKPLPG
jgi:hypothetical protein